jgi:hypothetical protein
MDLDNRHRSWQLPSIFIALQIYVFVGRDLAAYAAEMWSGTHLLQHPFCVPTCAHHR